MPPPTRVLFRDWQASCPPLPAAVYILCIYFKLYILSILPCLYLHHFVFIFLSLLLLLLASLSFTILWMESLPWESWNEKHGFSTRRLTTSLHPVDSCWPLPCHPTEIPKPSSNSTSVPYQVINKCEKGARTYAKSGTKDHICTRLPKPCIRDLQVKDQNDGELVLPRTAELETHMIGVPSDWPTQSPGTSRPRPPEIGGFMKLIWVWVKIKPPGDRRF